MNATLKGGLMLKKIFYVCVLCLVTVISSGCALLKAAVGAGIAYAISEAMD